MELTNEQKKALDEMVQRRLENTDETETEARAHIAKFFEERASELQARKVRKRR